jgi:hypothetical protein
MFDAGNRRAGAGPTAPDRLAAGTRDASSPPLKGVGIRLIFQ